MTEATISIRPVAIIGHQFTDGQCIFETASFEKCRLAQAKQLFSHMRHKGAAA